jgi:hypothetical protein
MSIVLMTEEQLDEEVDLILRVRARRHVGEPSAQKKILDLIQSQKEAYGEALKAKLLEDFKLVLNHDIALALTRDK